MSFQENSEGQGLEGVKEKEIKHMKWNSEKQREELDYIEKYKIDFISKNFQGTIQNDNLAKGNIFETWFPTTFPSENSTGQVPANIFKRNVIELPEEDHLMVNGYANSWVIRVDEVCPSNPQTPMSFQENSQGQGLEGVNVERNSNCIRNSDGSYDMELVVEFWPQRLFYIGAFISITTLLSCLGYLGYDYYRRKKL
jgi:hypothetical protein